MESSRDDSRTCAHCGDSLPDRAGGGRRADYCSRACQGRAYRARAATRHGTSRDESQWAALTARAATAEAEAASLREQLDAALLRVDELAAELAAARTTKDTVAAPQKTKPPAAAAPGTPALPPRIDQYKATPRWEPVTTTEGKLWHVFADDVPIGTVRQFGSGTFDPTLPNGFEVYLGSTARTMEEAAGKLVTAYAGWAGYWNSEAEARLTLLKPREDGSRTVKWGRQIIGRVGTASEAGLGGNGSVAYTPKHGIIGVRGQGTTRFVDEQHAAEALLDHWRADNPPPWGELASA